MAIEGEPRGGFGEVLAVFGRLGLTSFGGPVAHLGYFREEFVVRRRWLDEATYADIVALCQFLPGPASSQVGMTIGIMRAGLAGGLAAWLGFTLPSALALIAFAYGVSALSGLAASGALHGLKLMALAVVAQAVWGMARTLCPDRARATIAIAAAVLALVWPVALAQVAIIALAGLVGWRLLPPGDDAGGAPLQIPFGRGLALAALVAFFGLLIGLPLLRATFPTVYPLALADAMYRSGALVFGGGHIVLPLLQAETVPPGWLTTDQFLAGYGAAQAVPGPLFTFAAYLGAVATPQPNGALGGLLALLAIFVPAWLLVIGALPFWEGLRARADVRRGLRGVNAGVVGLLLAALYTPIFTSAVRTPVDMGFALILFALLLFWKVPPWGVAVLAAVGGWAAGAVGGIGQIGAMGSL